MQIKSIPIEELINRLIQYIEKHPESKNKQVYHDALHLSGDIEDKGDFLELY